MRPTRDNADVIVIGGGVAGLACARSLAARGRRVVLLEARTRLGGRIETRRVAGWGQPVELGAEFVHGGNPDLWRLLGRAGIRPRRVPESHWLLEGGRLARIRGVDRQVMAVTGAIDPRRAGSRSFAAYFRRFPSKAGPRAWALARAFVEGFEAAPLGGVSALSLAGESLDEASQYRLPQGYGQLVESLAADCRRLSVDVRTGCVVRSVRWSRGGVLVAARGGPAGARRLHAARAAVVTLPVGVLQARGGAGAVRFRPELGRTRACIGRMRMGDVFRMVLRFSAGPLRRLVPRLRARAGLGFFHTPLGGVPVWWALTGRPVLVGWAGGPRAAALLRLGAAARRRAALSSLAGIFGVPSRALGAALAGCEHHDWSADPFSRGGYSYTAAGQDGAAAQLRRPLQGTLFFAGEATAEGPEVGTVHGAVRSGIRAAGEAARALAGAGQRGPRKKASGGRPVAPQRLAR